MGHLSYEESKSRAYRIIIILGIITIIEVLVALVAKGFIIKGFEMPIALSAVLMIGMSLFKAYLIVYEFMHMKYELPDLVKTVLLPTGLLVWAVIAFFWEGADWQKRRNLIDNKNAEKVERQIVPTGSLIDTETKELF